MLLKFSLFYLSSPNARYRFAAFSISMTGIILSIVIVSRRRIIIRRRMRRRGVVFFLLRKRHLWQDVFVVYRRTTRFEDRAFVLSPCRARLFPLDGIAKVNKSEAARTRASPFFRGFLDQDADVIVPGRARLRTVRGPVEPRYLHLGLLHLLYGRRRRHIRICCCSELKKN